MKQLKPQDPPRREALSVGEAARTLGVGKETIFRLLREGHLRRVKLGRRTLIPAVDLPRLVERLAEGD
jgi:excisionase family DNA binding protein